MVVEDNGYNFFSKIGEPANYFGYENWDEKTLKSLHFKDNVFQTNLNILLNANIPMFLFWGNDYLCFYNEAYKENNYKAALSSKMGMSGEDFWKDKWSDIKLAINKILLSEKDDTCLKKHFDNFLSFSSIYNKHGKIEGILIICNQKDKFNFFDNIENNEPFTKTILENSPDCIKVIDKNASIVYMNNNGVNILEANSKQDFINKKWTALWEDEYLPLLNNAIKKAFNGTVTSFKAPANTLKGTTKWWEVIVSPIKNNSEQTNYLLITSRDITAHNSALLEIAASEHKFKTLADNIPNLAWMANADGWIFWYNKKWYEYTGTTKEEMEGWGWQSVHDPTELPHVLKKWTYAISVGEPFEMIFPIRAADGSFHHFLTRILPIKNKEGVIEQWFGTNTNISNHINTENALQQSLLMQDETLAQLNSLLENAPVGFAFFDMHHKYVKINDCLAEINGLAVEEHIGKSITEVLLDTGKNVIPILQQIASTKKPVLNLEIKGQTPKAPGIDRYWLTNFYPILNKKNKEVNFIGAVVSEITERKKIENEIKESENRFRALAETIPQLVWETDAAGNELFTSSKWNEFIDHTLSKEDYWKKMVHPDDYERINKSWHHSLTTGERYATEVRLKNKNGAYIWHTVAGDPVFDANHIIIKWIGAFTDINAEKEFANSLKKQVEDRTNDLAKANEFLELKNDELEKMNKELQSFAYISSHDLQEPLRKIQIFSAQIMDKEFEHLTEDGKNKFQRIENAAKRMKTLIEDLLAYSRTTVSDRKFEATDFSVIVDQVKEDLREEILLKNAIVTSLSTEVIFIIPFQFRQLLYNLISNSLKFAAENKCPEIVIQTKIVNAKDLKNQFHTKSSKYFNISLSDNGIGFDQQYSSKIFEVFQRLHGKTEYNGTGIGLAIVKKIVDNHQGFIIAEGKLEEGAIFNIYIPHQ